jgi:hypothetical protein
MERADF